MIRPDNVIDKCISCGHRHHEHLTDKTTQWEVGQCWYCKDKCQGFEPQVIK